MDRLNRGSLPGLSTSPHFQDDLKAYVGTYLQQDIRAEGLARSIENLSRVLEVAGLTSGEQIKLTSPPSGVPKNREAQAGRRGWGLSSRTSPRANTSMAPS